MYRVSLALLGLLTLSLNKTLAQQVSYQTHVIHPSRIAVGSYKTSNLIFPSAIKGVDRGSAAIIVQKAKEAENILQVKANFPSFAETNITVITVDGKFYSFLVTYTADPTNINLAIDTGYSDPSVKIIQADETLGTESLSKIAGAVRKKSPFMNVYVKREKVRFSLEKLYLKEGLMWFGLKVQNRSYVDYKPESVRLSIRDRMELKRTAQQEIEVLPVYTNLDFVINGKSTSVFVFACEPFTISPSKELAIQIAEKNGMRALRLRASNRVLLNAKLLK